MSVTRHDVGRFAELARLRLDPDELDRLTADLNRILEHVDVLGSLAEGSGPDEPAPGLIGPVSPARAEAPDRLHRSPEELAPEWEAGFFVVPRLPGIDAESDE